MFQRDITAYLKAWKEKQKRKPLLVRGARQVGKTFAVLQFGKEAFEQVAYLNLENPEHARHFRSPLTLQEFLAVVKLQFSVPVVPGKTLIFIDEIQHSPALVKLLRFFYEDMPQLHVIAAGSLLEAFIARGGFEIPVGRIEYLYMHPLNFYEFLGALGKPALVGALQQVRASDALPAPIHDELLRLFQKYMLFGGMPEAVGAAARGALDELPAIYNSLLTAFSEDTAKYSNRAQSDYLSFIIDHAPHFAGSTVTYEHFAGSRYRSREMARGFALLAQAMLVSLVGGTTSLALPIIEKPKRAKKLLFLDTGLVSYRAKLPHEEVRWDRFSSALKGTIFEQAVGQMLVALGVHERPQIAYWTRETTPTELDFCFAFGNAMVGMEVKSGSGGHLKSLASFGRLTRGSKLVAVSSKPLSVETMRMGIDDPLRLLHLPFYLVPRIYDFLADF